MFINFCSIFYDVFLQDEQHKYKLKYNKKCMESEFWQLGKLKYRGIVEFLFVIYSAVNLIKVTQDCIAFFKGKNIID